MMENFCDESACGPTLLKNVSITDILIDQVHKFQNSDFWRTPAKAATVLQKKHIV